jgi:lysophospholipase L1-like esterase
MLEFPPILTRCARVILACIPPVALAATPADQGVQRLDEAAKAAHLQLVEKAHRGRIDLYFLGDSITRRWGATDYPEFLANWNQNFHGWNAAIFGVGGDTTQNMLWRIENGELDGVNPKVIVLLAGTNDVGRTLHPDAAEEVPKRIKAIIELCHAKAPGSTVILTAIFPRNDTTEANPVIGQINTKIATFADAKKVRFLNINDQLADQNGQLRDGMTIDKLHLSAKGYQIWADALKPLLMEILGPPLPTGSAPTATSEPGIAK